MPTIGAPPPVKLLADWLPIPPDDDPELLLPVGLEPPVDELDPTPGPREKPEPPEGEEEEEEDPIDDPVLPAGVEAPLTVVVGCADTILDAAPNPPVPPPPGSPASGWPKKPFTVVFASPTWISRQSGLPVIGSSYFLRRKRVLFDFSN